MKASRFRPNPRPNSIGRVSALAPAGGQEHSAGSTSEELNVHARHSRPVHPAGPSTGFCRGCDHCLGLARLSDVGGGIPGIAGPGGGSEQKPVGTVCIAASTDGAERVRTFRFPGGREMVKTFAAGSAIDMVRRLLIDAGPDTDWVRRT